MLNHVTFWWTNQGRDAVLLLVGGPDCHTAFVPVLAGDFRLVFLGN